MSQLFATYSEYDDYHDPQVNETDTPLQVRVEPHTTVATVISLTSKKTYQSGAHARVFMTYKWTGIGDWIHVTNVPGDLHQNKTG